MSVAMLAVAVVLFASMFLPLPAPFGLAMALWALGAGVSVPLVLALYLAQDLLTYAAIRRLTPIFAHRSVAKLYVHVPLRIRAMYSHPLVVRALRPARCESALLPAALLSFYAAAALATVRRTAMLRSAAIVIGVDVLKYVNALAVALGASRLLPPSPLATVVAPLAGLAAVALLAALPRLRAVGSSLRWAVSSRKLAVE